MSILVLNAGSSSLKFSLFDAEALAERAQGLVDWTDPRPGHELVVRRPDGRTRRVDISAASPSEAAALAIEALFAESDPELGGLREVTAVGHRIVHGGAVFRESVAIDPGVVAELERISDLAPLHNPPALAGIASARRILPDVPHVAVFDTAYFASLAPERFIYPGPLAWYEQWGIRKFGFHGISHAYAAGRAAELLGRDPGGLRVVSCHLGNGCSATASRGGVALDTTMGYTPMDGLMMGSRCGAIDPGVLIDLQRRHGLPAEAIDRALNKESGLLGVSGLSPDFRAVSEAADSGHERARLALEIYAQRVRSAIGSLATALGGLDALVFTAGVGENSAALRAAVCEPLQFLGVQLDPERNQTLRPDADLASASSPVRVLAIAAREDRLIAREARRVAAGSRA